MKIEPNPQLEALLTGFSQQPGVTPDQVSQLRDAVASQADTLQRCNQEAANGHLQGFVLESGEASLTGTFDKQSGIASLPAASFQAGAVTASADLKAAVALQSMTAEFAHRTYLDAAGHAQPVDQDMVGNLQRTINGSPVLAAQMKDATQQGHLRKFDVLPPSMSAGATYNGSEKEKSISMPPVGLQSLSAANTKGRFEDNDLTFVLAHEVQHGFNREERMQANKAFGQNVVKQAAVKAPEHDYTDELRAYIQAGRQDEAKAQIAGWNALLSKLQTEIPEAGINNMAATKNSRLLDFVTEISSAGQSTPLPNLTFNPDGSLPMTAANIAGMGQNYFDRPSPLHAQPGQRPVGIGEHKDPQTGQRAPTADYPNYTARSGIEYILQIREKSTTQYQGARPRLVIDMASLGLSEHLLENEGIDLGKNKAPRPYYDSSQTPATLRHFDHTKDGSVNPAHDHQHVPVDGRQAQGQPSAAPGLSAYLDRMLFAAHMGDDATFRQMTRELAEQPAGQQLREQASAAVDQQELLAQQVLEQQRIQAQQQLLIHGPGMMLR